MACKLHRMPSSSLLQRQQFGRAARSGDLTWPRPERRPNRNTAASRSRRAVFFDHYMIVAVLRVFVILHCSYMFFVDHYMLWCSECLLYSIARMQYINSSEAKPDLATKKSPLQSALKIRL
jgi:hypothetical protein